MIPAALFIVGAYLLGAIPFGLLIGKAQGIDIREHGSRNIGATNAGRVLGRKWGFVCLALDMLKGLAPVLAAKFVLISEPHTSMMLLCWIGVAIAAVLGHNFPIYLGFKGGKGVATTIGVALGVFPYFTVGIIVALIAYGVGRYATGIVSIGSLALAAVFPLAVWGYLAIERPGQIGTDWPLVVVSVLLALMIIVRHRANIARLMRGEELAVRANSQSTATAE